LASAGNRQEQEDGQVTVAARAGTATNNTRRRKQITDRNRCFFTKTPQYKNMQQ
jgi:hypothetical protein